MSIYYPAHDLWMIVGNRDSVEGPFVLHAYALRDLTVPRATLKVLGDTTLGGRGIGFAFVPELNAFFLRSSTVSDAQKIWKLTPPAGNPLVAPWTIQEITMEGARVTEGGHRGYYKRFCYAAKIGCLIWVSSTRGAVYAYRPHGL